MKQIAEESYFLLSNGHYQRAFCVTIFEPTIDAGDNHIWNCLIEIQSNSGSLQISNSGASSLQALSFAAANAILHEVIFLKSVPAGKQLYYGKKDEDLLDNSMRSSMTEGALKRLELLEASLIDLMKHLKHLRT